MDRYRSKFITQCACVISQYTGCSIVVPMAESRVKVEHDPKAQKFSINFEEGEAVLLYDTLPDGTLDFHHTEVPPALRGRGIAGQLAEAGLGHARVNGSKVQLTCSYMQHYVNKHQEHQSLLAASTQDKL